MDQSDLSRRDAFKLAKFGILLAAGLGIAERSFGESDDPQLTNGKTSNAFLKYQPNSMILKLYKVNADGAPVQYRESSLSVSQVKLLGARGVDTISLKFMKGSQAVGGLSEVMLKL